MSNYEWERGTFKLPSAEFADFRQKIQDVDRLRKEKAFAQTQAFWKGLSRKQQSDPAAYHQAINAWEPGRETDGSYGHPRRPWSAPDPLDDAAHELARALLYRKVDAWKTIDGRHQRDPDHKPSRVLASEVEYPTNRTICFTDTDCSVTFDKDAKTVTWDVQDNNHAVDHAHASAIGMAFFDRLGKVRWTHGTGGSLAYHSEYHDEDRSVGGGGNTCSGAYGYLGIAENPTNARPFTNAKGERIEAEIKVGKFGFVGKAVKAGSGGYGSSRVVRGVPTGGQFVTRGRGESGIRL